MFLVFVIATFRILFRFAELVLLIFRSGRQVAKGAIDEDLRAANEERKRRLLSTGAEVRERFKNLRGDLVVGLMLLLFTSEIILVNPQGTRSFHSLQLLYLVELCLYQLSYYREAHRPYVWGYVNGRRYVEDIRWLLVIGQAFAVLTVFLSAFLDVKTAQPSLGLGIWAAWACELFCIEAAVAAAVIAMPGVFSSNDTLIAIGLDADFDPASWEADEHGKIWESIKTWRAVTKPVKVFVKPFNSKYPVVRRNAQLCALVLAIPAGFWLWFHRSFSRGPGWLIVALKQPSWLRATLVGLPLILTLLVLLNVILIGILFERRRRFLQEWESSLPHPTWFWERSPSQSSYPASGFAKLSINRGELPSRRNLGADWEIYTRRTALVVVLYVVSVLSFGLIVYPHIPVQKAGGNYETAPHFYVRPMIATAYGEGCPAKLLPSLIGKQSFIELEEDSDWVYLAVDDDSGGPTCWVWSAMNTSDRSYCRPKVFAIHRSCVASVYDAAAGPP